MHRRAAALLLALPLCAAPARAADVRGVPLVDQRGAAFALRDLRGHPAAVTFVATRCTDVCPIADGVFARVAIALRRARSDARLVTITLDPSYDTPYVMASAARAYAADPARWRWASGRVSDVERVLAAFGVAHDADGSHGTFVYVLDRRGALRRTLPLAADGGRAIVAALR